jgi:hypothetical protein
MDMDSKMNYFSNMEVNLLVRILIAHILTDFVFQSDKMVKLKKNWLSSSMLIHIFIAFAATFILSGELVLSLFVAISHWTIDGLKIEFQNKNRYKASTLFFADQFFHMVFILVIWLIHHSSLDQIWNVISTPFMNFNFSIYLLGYLFIIFPTSFIVKLVAQNFIPTTYTTATEESIQYGGRTIGYFERIIILTLVLLNEYEAIGFLITGKSIMRFADPNSNLRSEYVLVGTMMSYAIAILSGIIMKFMIDSSNFIIL